MMDEGISEIQLLFFCYESLVENKNLPNNAKNQDFELKTFFVKENNIENVADKHNQ